MAAALPLKAGLPYRALDGRLFDRGCPPLASGCFRRIFWNDGAGDHASNLYLQTCVGVRIGLSRLARSANASLDEFLLPPSIYVEGPSYPVHKF